MDQTELLNAMRANYKVASEKNWGKTLVSMLLFLPPIASLFTSSANELYFWSVISFGIALIWIVAHLSYVKARTRSQAARRALMLTNCSAEKLHRCLKEDLRDNLSNQSVSISDLKPESYYSSKSEAGPKRVVEIVEESAFYSERTHKLSYFFFSVLTSIFFLLFFGFLLMSATVEDRSQIELVLQMFLVLSLFIVSNDILVRALDHYGSYRECRRIQERCVTLLGSQPTSIDSQIVLADYFGAIQSAPETVEWAFTKRKREATEQEWARRKAL